MKIQTTRSTLIAAAVSGLLFGSNMGCSKEEVKDPAPGTSTPAPASQPGSVMEKHVCKALNSCKGQGGCGSTKGKNECKGKGECATVAHHDCGGKNDCKAKGLCAVPLKH